MSHCKLLRTNLPGRAARIAFWAASAVAFATLFSSGAFAAATELPLKTDASFDLWRTALNAIFIAVLCLGVAAAVLYAWRHRMQMQGGRTVLPDAASVEWARRVSPRTTLLVVRWRGRHYLLSENGGATQVIDSHQIEEPQA